MKTQEKKHFPIFGRMVNFYHIILRKILFVISLFLLGGSITAQTSSSGSQRIKYAKFAELEYLDTAMVECIYEYKVIDKELDQTETYYDILQIGNNVSKYFGYPKYQTDSVCYKRDIHKITTSEGLKIFNTYKYSASSPYEIIKNRTENHIRYYDKVFIDYFIYQDSVSFDWTLKNDTLTLGGYLCKQATCEFRGRSWIAYYTEDIPVSDGPSKFMGLPGLILQIEDTQKEHCFSIISIRNSNSNIYVYKNDYLKTTRERFNKQLKAFKTDPGKIISGSQLMKDVNTGKEVNIPKRKLFFNPIELN